MDNKIITARTVRCQCGSEMSTYELKAKDSSICGFLIHCPGCKRFFIEGGNL
jgi:hypothetical protein